VGTGVLARLPQDAPCARRASALDTWTAGVRGQER